MITQRLGYDDYIVAVIELYLDMMNLVVYVFSCGGGPHDIY